MAHQFTFTVTIELERTEGKFAARDEMSEQLVEWLENANEQDLYGLGADGESTYTVEAWNVEEVDAR